MKLLTTCCCCPPYCCCIQASCAACCCCALICAARMRPCSTAQRSTGRERMVRTRRRERKHRPPLASAGGAGAQGPLARLVCAAELGPRTGPRRTSHNTGAAGCEPFSHTYIITSQAHHNAQCSAVSSDALPCPACLGTHLPACTHGAHVPCPPGLGRHARTRACNAAARSRLSLLHCAPLDVHVAGRDRAAPFNQARPVASCSVQHAARPAPPHRAQHLLEL